MYQAGATTVQQGAYNNLSKEIASLSSICAQPCEFVGPDAEANALVYASVRVLLLRTMEQQDNIGRLSELMQSGMQELRQSIGSCLEDVKGLRSHMSTFQQNIQEVYSTLQDHRRRVDQLEGVTRSIGNIDQIISSFEQRLQVNSSSVSSLELQVRELTANLGRFCTGDMMEQRCRELNDQFQRRLTTAEQLIQNLCTCKADMSQIPAIVAAQINTSVSPLENDVNVLLRLWELNKTDVHSVCQNANVSTRVNLLHSTPAFRALIDSLRGPSLPSVIVGPASMSGSSNISVTTSSGAPLSPRSGGSSYLGIEVGPSPSGGVTVTRVIPGTPASNAGLHVGDVLIGMNGQAFGDVSGLVERTRSFQASKPPGGANISLVRFANGNQEQVNLWIQ